MPVQYAMIYLAAEAWKKWKSIPDKRKKEINEKAQAVIYRELGYKKPKRTTKVI